MKITKTEKIVLGTILAVIALDAFFVWFTFKEIDEAGGIKQVIIEAGKELKEIKRQIDKED